MSISRTTQELYCYRNKLDFKCKHKLVYSLVLLKKRQSGGTQRHGRVQDIKSSVHVMAAAQKGDDANS